MTSPFQSRSPGPSGSRPRLRRARTSARAAASKAEPDPAGAAAAREPEIRCPVPLRAESVRPDAPAAAPPIAACLPRRQDPDLSLVLIMWSIDPGQRQASFERGSCCRHCRRQVIQAHAAQTRQGAHLARDRGQQCGACAVHEISAVGSEVGVDARDPERCPVQHGPYDFKAGDDLIGSRKAA